MKAGSLAAAFVCGMLLHPQGKIQRCRLCRIFSTVRLAPEGLISYCGEKRVRGFELRLVTTAKLLVRAEEAGLGNYITFDNVERDVLANASEHYAGRGSFAKKFQYMDLRMVLTGFKDLPNLDAVAAIADKVLHHPVLQKEYLEA